MVAIFNLSLDAVAVYTSLDEAFASSHPIVTRSVTSHGTPDAALASAGFVTRGEWAVHALLGLQTVGVVRDTLA